MRTPDAAAPILGPLPFAELDAAGQALLEQCGAARAARDALEILDHREVADITRAVEQLDLIALRRRLRAIAGGSLRAGRLDKALAAKTLELAGITCVAEIVDRRRRFLHDVGDLLGQLALAA